MVFWVVIALGTIYLMVTATGYIRQLIENPPNHLLSIVYCIVFSLIMIFGLLKDKIAKSIATVATVLALVVCVLLTQSQPFEVYQNAFLEENEIVLVGEPYISYWAGSSQGEVVIHQYNNDDGTKGYSFAFSGDKGKTYHFAILDSATEEEYYFKYYFDDVMQAVVVEREERDR